MIKYECVKPFLLNKYDEHGACIESETILVEDNTGWFVDEDLRIT